MRVKRNQTCVYWSPAGVNDFGEPEFSAPVEVTCRWEDKAQLFVDKEGKEAVSTSIVYPEQTLLLGGYICLTTLDVLSTEEEANPRIVTGAKEIRNVSASPNLRGDWWLYKVWL